MKGTFVHVCLFPFKLKNADVLAYLRVDSSDPSRTHGHIVFNFGAKGETKISSGSPICGIHEYDPREYYIIIFDFSLPLRHPPKQGSVAVSAGKSKSFGLF